MDGVLSAADVTQCLTALNKAEVQTVLDDSQKEAVDKLCKLLERANRLSSNLCTETNGRSQDSLRPVGPKENTLASQQTDEETDGQIAAELRKIHSWDTFDVFELSSLVPGRVLEVVALFVFKLLGLVTHFDLDVTKLTSFLQSVEASYNANPYHNSTHAADVVQSLAALLTADQLLTKLSEVELLAVVLSAVVHDVNHPGVTNDFLVRTRSQQALLYNDNSPNENMHAARAFELLSRPGHNFLDALTAEQYSVTRRLVIEIVLATDMAGHACVLANFQAGKNALGPDVALWPAAFRKYVLMMLMHCADIGNPAKPLAISLQWTDRILQESWAQGEKEKQLGIPVSPLCDQEVVHVPTMQQHFLEHFVQPTFLAMSELAPVLSCQALRHIATNIQHWKDMTAGTSDRL